MAKVAVCKAADVAPGSLLKASAGGRELVVANVDGRFYAVDDTCTHAGASLSEGRLEGGNIVCGWHGAQFECATGCLAKFPAKISDLGSYAAAVEGEDVVVEV